MGGHKLGSLKFEVPVQPDSTAPTLSMPVALTVTVDKWDGFGDRLTKAFEGVKLVALDCEGVDLMRHPGKLSIVQIATESPSHCFLLDVLDKDESDPLVTWLRRVLEDDSIEKIIHDCRMDSDALMHNVKIKLANVHDTSCWNAAITGIDNEALNTVLERNGAACTGGQGWVCVQGQPRLLGREATDGKDG